MKNITETGALAFRTAESVAVNTNDKPKITNVNSYYFWTPATCLPRTSELMWCEKCLKDFWDSSPQTCPAQPCLPWVEVFIYFAKLKLQVWAAGSSFTSWPWPRTFDSGFVISVIFVVKSFPAHLFPTANKTKSFTLFVVHRNSFLSPGHLKEKAGQNTLTDWIFSSSYRQSLYDLN